VRKITRAGVALYASARLRYGSLESVPTMIIAGTKGRWVVACLAAVAVASGVMQPASGEAPAKPRAAAVRPGTDGPAVARWTERLQKSTDPDEIRATLAEVAEAGKRASPVAPAIADLLRRGTTPALAAQGLAALRLIGTPAQTAAVAPYARHRIADLRIKAAIALGTCGGERAVSTLRQTLGDVEPAVRGSAASALGALGASAHDALPDLYAALDHNVLEAAAAIAELCVREECGAFAGKTGKIGLDVMTSGFDALLFRPSNEVPDEQKIKVVERVRDLRTVEANKYLRDVQSRLPANGSVRLKQAVDEAVLATAGATS
jgi:hypothetical protein